MWKTHSVILSTNTAEIYGIPCKPWDAIYRRDYSYLGDTAERTSECFWFKKIK